MYRINRLIQEKRRLFHTQDLALVWGITDSNLLYTTIKRYVKSGVLNRIHKGFYSTVPAREIDELVLGLAYYHDYAYLSTETVLAREGMINRQPTQNTFVGVRPAKFSLNGRHYLFRQMKSERLFKTRGLARADGILTADRKRAIEDMKYFNPKFYFDREVK